MSHLLAAPLVLTPDLRVRPWAGTRLGPAEAHVGEAWLAHDGSVVAAGPGQGRTLGELTEQWGAALLGERARSYRPGGLPILIKLIDSSGWLSVQVHPDDAQARRVDAIDAVGKTESWLVLEDAPGAAIVRGPRPDIEPARVLEAVGTADLVGLLDITPVRAGDRVHVPARTLHAIGPGLLIYEVQQHCDITYRAWDWERVDREMHTAQIREVLAPSARADIRREHEPGCSEEPDLIAACPYYHVRRVELTTVPLEAVTDPDAASIVTVVDGEASLTGRAGQVDLQRYETALLPASMGAYSMRAPVAATLLVATWP